MNPPSSRTTPEDREIEERSEPQEAIGLNRLCYQNIFITKNDLKTHCGNGIIDIFFYD